jgi:hypothetical protein
VTAYVLKLNNIDAGPELSAATARKIRLVAGHAAPDPEGVAVSSGKDSAPDGVELPASNATLLPAVAALAVILLLAGGIFWRRRARR